eukprot:1256304-Alexandrium_andersonii.AAC.1
MERTLSGSDIKLWAGGRDFVCQVLTTAMNRRGAAAAHLRCVECPTCSLARFFGFVIPGCFENFF